MYDISRNQLIVAFVVLASLISTVSADAANPKIAIVIDDIGYRASDQAAVDLKGQFTFAIIPFAPLTQKLAQAIHDSKRESIVHFPMEAFNDNHLLGKGALYADMDEATVRATVKRSLENVPYAHGINNHMGSKFTTASQPLSWLMDELKQRDFYFLDSRTTAQSVAEQSALASGIKTAHRHIFLDNQRDHQYLAAQFKRLLAIAQSNRYAIAIAHPHPETIAFLNSIHDTLVSENIDLVPLSKLLTISSSRAIQTKPTATTIRVTAPH